MRDAETPFPSDSSVEGRKSVGGRGSIEARNAESIGSRGSVNSHESVGERGSVEKRDAGANDTRARLIEEKEAVETALKIKGWVHQWIESKLNGLQMPKDYRFDVQTEEKRYSPNGMGNLAVIIDFYRGDGQPASVELLPAANLALGSTAFDVDPALPNPFASNNPPYEEVKRGQSTYYSFTKNGLEYLLDKKDGVVNNWILDLQAEFKKS